METKIDLKSSGSEMNCYENNKRHHNCKQCSQYRGRSTLMGAVLMLGAVLLMLLCWNYHLSRELIKMRGDVNALLSRCERLKEEPRDHSHFIKDKKQDNAVQKYVSNAENYLQYYNEDQEEMNEHVIKKRSRDSQTKKGKKRGDRVAKRNKQIYKLLRQQKGVAIHVGAQFSENDGNSPNSHVPNPGVPVSGKTITNWEMPENAGSTNFGTSALQRDGYITVPADGYYFVYSQVIFEKTDTNEVAAEIGVGPLGGTPFTKCLLTKDRTKKEWSACHANGIKKLRKGDGISLVVHPPEVEVYMAKEFTYFGAFLIGL